VDTFAVSAPAATADIDLRNDPAWTEPKIRRSRARAPRKPAPGVEESSEGDDDKKPDSADDRDKGKSEDKGQDNKDDDKKDGDKKDGNEKDGDKKDEKPKSRWPIIILAVVVVLAIIGGLIYWLMTRNLATTDDAYTDGNAVSIAPKIAGYVTELDVNDNTYVHAGDVLLRIDQRDYITARDQAAANLTLARAQLVSAQLDLEISRVRSPAQQLQAEAQLSQARANQTLAALSYRRQHEVDPRATTRTDVDQANAQLQSNSAQVSSAEAQVRVADLVQQNIAEAEATVAQREAQVKQAEASLEQAEVNLSYTIIRAPQDGHVTRRNVQLGTFVQAGSQAFYLVTPALWVIANFKETQLTRIHPGEHVDITVDAYPALALHGHVDSIQAGSGDRFSTFPAENATGNYVKIVRRVPVKIIVDDGIDKNQGLPLGISVSPTVHLE
jgi:membrane fusion protein (multidrug efflux system)